MLQRIYLKQKLRHAKTNFQNSKIREIWIYDSKMKRKYPVKSHRKKPSFSLGYNSSIQAQSLTWISEITQDMPVFSDPSYVPDIHKELQDFGIKWKTMGLKAAAQFAWGVMLRQLSQYPMAAGLYMYIGVFALVMHFASSVS